MNELEAFAAFLKDYGAYALSAVFAGLHFLERRERQATQAKHEAYLEAVPKQLKESTEAQAQAVENLERAFIRAGVRLNDEDRR
jgi:hypothetical protein